MTTQPSPSGPGALRIVWAVTTLPYGLVVGFLAVFAVSPVTCPDTGGGRLCRAPSAGSVALALMAGLLLTAVALAFLPIVRPGTRTTGWSALYAGGALALVIASAASW